MSNSQEQSLNENVVFPQLTKSCPDFLYSEKEREALEMLLSSGPEAFYSSSSSCFLSSEEVSQINSWAQNYHPNQEDKGEECCTQMEDFCSTYFPCHSDFPAPNLELGWPEKKPWMLKGSATVHTSPPAEGHPPIREIIRRHLQQASQVIAIVTDRLTDSAVIDDLHCAASRGVPVYIILNQRSIQENFTLSRLKHPNMQVRLLGGKTFCSRAGRMVVGEMKDKFLLVDLEIVIHGSYSLTWTDAHLHRQLITVLTGPVVDSFDREFRILFAASLPVPDSWRVMGAHVNTSQQLTAFSEHRFKEHLSVESEITNPPSPPNALLDWDEMGVVQRDDRLLSSPFSQHEEMPLQNNTPITDGVTNNGNHFVERRMVWEITTPVMTGVPEKITPFNNTRLLPTDPTTTEMMKRVENRIEKAISRQLSTEKSTNVYDRNSTNLKDEAAEPTYMLSPTQRRERSRTIMEEQSNTVENYSNVDYTSSSRRPIILRVPQTDTYSSLSDIMRRIQQSSPDRLRRGPNSTLSERTQSMMDLSTHNTDTHHDERGPVPRYTARFDPNHMTPALALMRKRNEESRAELYRTPKNFVPRDRPRSSSFAFNMDWTGGHR
ncbi:protein FAM83E [Parambassis ranga]|uniref:Protein FAM83E n=1 Tax=Parambassis ranga TaxID=210632 RepID=A0A6P7I4B1_9TELE|nr:protein FAM83E-like [Parambassis ranga]